ncbi:hypothetical protein [Agromyces laixinhei]|uniref:hypothetical protein n=1 Tax=Agromyces laixinhei TaxID=2585717 RepID=UPI0012EE2180|nr:hypothetical protein [Agromyces laixinhei]
MKSPRRNQERNLPGQAIGSLIAASFGLVYVLVNTGAMADAVQIALRVAAVVAFIAVAVSVVTLVRRHRESADRTPAESRPSFGLSYWLVVVAEVAAILVGTRVLAGPLDLPQAGVAWVSTVVGVHFFALAIVFRQRFFHILGVAITLCGMAGLGIALTGGGEAWIDLVSGVVPGGILLAAGWWGARRRTATENVDAEIGAPLPRS